MRERYLMILGLDSDASEQDIKAAYRKLSKIYHPDVNHSIDAKEKFIEIKYAYEYLIQGEFDVSFQNEYSSAYDEAPSDLEIRRAEDRARARKRDQEKWNLQQELIKKSVRFITPVVTIILCFNALLTLDFFLPYYSVSQQIVGVRPVFERSGKNGPLQHCYDGVHLTDYVMRFDKYEMLKLDHYEKAIVYATPILRKPMKLKITVDGLDEIHQQIYNVYYVFGYMIPALIIVCVLFFILKKMPQRFNMAVVAVVFFIFQMVLFASV